MFASVLSLCSVVCGMISVTHGELAVLGNLAFNAYVPEFLPNGTAGRLTLRCSLTNEDITFNNIFMSDLSKVAAVAKYKNRPVSRWGSDVETYGCSDCRNSSAPSFAACQAGEKAFLEAFFVDYARYVNEDARRFMCYFRGNDATGEAVQEKITTIVELTQHVGSDVIASGLDLAVSGRYRLNGKLRTAYYRCAVTTEWARIDSVGISVADENVTFSNEDTFLRNVHNADDLAVTGSVNCSGEPEGADRGLCHTGDYAFIDIVWENYRVEKWGLEWANVNCTVNGDKDGDGNFDTQYGLIVYRISEPPNSPAANWAKDKEGKMELTTTHFLDEQGELSKFAARCNVYKGIGAITQIQIYNSNFTDQVYVDYGGDINFGSDPRIKRNGSNRPSRGGRLGYASLDWSSVDLSSDFPSNTGDLLYLTCRIVHARGVEERVKAFRIRNGRRS